MALSNIYTHIYKTMIHKIQYTVCSCAYRTIKIDKDAIKHVTTYKSIRIQTKNKISRNIKKRRELTKNKELHIDPCIIFLYHISW